jgi:hypothetical protein
MISAGRVSIFRGGWQLEFVPTAGGCARVHFSLPFGGSEGDLTLDEYEIFAGASLLGAVPLAIMVVFLFSPRRWKRVMWA